MTAKIALSLYRALRWGFVMASTETLISSSIQIPN